MRSVYIHIPFCGSKCSYCDFYSVANVSYEIKRKVILATIEEIKTFVYKNPRDQIVSIYIGGGSPNSISSDLLRQLFLAVRESFNFSQDIEWSIEANPEFISIDFLKLCREFGVNRLSLGVQSFNDNFLQGLQRRASRLDVLTALNIIRQTWTGGLNIDLMFGMEGQKVSDLVSDLQEAVSFSPDHISLYSLTVEENTPLSLAVANGDIKLPNQETSMQLWDKGISFLNDNGYKRYEISAFSLPGRECKHNLQYWKYMPYAGFGPAAVGLMPGPDDRILRRENPADIFKYLNGEHINEEIAPIDALKEQLMMSFRLTAGLDNKTLRRRFGGYFGDLFPKTAGKWQSEGLLETNAENVFLKKKGSKLLNAFLIELFSEADKQDIGAVVFP